MTWQQINDNGTCYDLSHLQEFQFEAMRPETENEKGWIIPVQVMFGWHCYTRKPQENETSKIFKKGREERCFCPERFEKSHILPEIIQGLMERKIFQTGKGNYITIEVMDEEGGQTNYEIYFSLKKQAKGQPLKLFVESAYTRDKNSGGNRQKRKRQVIRFRVLAYNIHHGRGVRYST